MTLPTAFAVRGHGDEEHRKEKKGQWPRKPPQAPPALVR